MFLESQQVLNTSVCYGQQCGPLASINPPAQTLPIDQQNMSHIHHNTKSSFLHSEGSFFSQDGIPQQFACGFHSQLLQAGYQLCDA
jgi:hypothetical protein